MLLHQVQSLRGMLDRVVGVLVDRTDEEGETLRGEARSLRCSASQLEAVMAQGAESTADVDELRSILERGRALVERTRRYADQHELPFLVVKTPLVEGEPTQPFTEGEIRALIDNMPPGATSPPPAVAEAAAEAQMIGRYSTIPSPPPPAPLAETTKT
ncbi:MAG TPA: hypothetical protein VGI39_01465 [Polyangiaceae bacterium]|jgi:hypothetical protein